MAVLFSLQAVVCVSDLATLAIQVLFSAFVCCRMQSGAFVNKLKGKNHVPVVQLPFV